LITCAGHGNVTWIGGIWIQPSLGSLPSIRGNLLSLLRHEVTSSLKEGKPSSAPKTVKIAHQQIRLTAL